MLYKLTRIKVTCKNHKGIIYFLATRNPKR
jgi:hypothetical protein